MSTKKTILIAGGAGYIGSHIANLLKNHKDYNLLIADDFSTGNKDAVKDFKVKEGDLTDKNFVDSLFKKNNIYAVIDMAAKKSLPESVSEPYKYYSNNLNISLNLLNGSKENQVERYIFSSTAAVYAPNNKPVNETSPVANLSPYGSSKLFTETIISDFAKASNLRFIILRYFNVAGAAHDGSIGSMKSSHPPHLVQACIEAALGLREKMIIYGSDFNTKDGTGVRDYIHIDDLAQAHIDALVFLENISNQSQILNCGYGSGYSVKEVIESVKRISKIDFKTEMGAKRDGDQGSVIANSDKIKEVLNWKPKYEDLDIMISDAYNWEKSKTSPHR